MSRCSDGTCRKAAGSVHDLTCNWPALARIAEQNNAHQIADGGGLRFDEGKTRVDLLPADALLELGKVYEYGSRKYQARNWERGMAWSKVIGPLLRHLFKWMMGQRIDEESGQRHIAMVAWNAIALLTYEIRGIGLDDRKGEIQDAKPDR